VAFLKVGFWSAPERFIGTRVTDQTLALTGLGVTLTRKSTGAEGKPEGRTSNAELGSLREATGAM
jgi:hypothetical protein